MRAAELVAKLAETDALAIRSGRDSRCGAVRHTPASGHGFAEQLRRASVLAFQRPMVLRRLRVHRGAALLDCGRADVLSAANDMGARGAGDRTARRAGRDRGYLFGAAGLVHRHHRAHGAVAVCEQAGLCASGRMDQRGHRRGRYLDVHRGRAWRRPIGRKPSMRRRSRRSSASTTCSRQGSPIPFAGTSSMVQTGAASTPVRQATLSNSPTLVSGRTGASGC